MDRTRVYLVPGSSYVAVARAVPVALQYLDPGVWWENEMPSILCLFLFFFFRRLNVPSPQPPPPPQNCETK